jgi:hypothetical protein
MVSSISRAPLQMELNLCFMNQRPNQFLSLQLTEEDPVYKVKPYLQVVQIRTTWVCREEFFRPGYSSHHHRLVTLRTQATWLSWTATSPIITYTRTSSMQEVNVWMLISFLSSLEKFYPTKPLNLILKFPNTWWERPIVRPNLTFVILLMRRGALWNLLILSRVVCKEAWVTCLKET